MVDAILLAHVREIHAEGVGGARGETSTVVWLTERQRISASTARRLIRLSAAMDRNAALHHTFSTPAQAPDPDADDVVPLPDGIRSARDAMGAGLLNLEQAEVITRTLTKLPTEDRATAETILVRDAQRFNPTVLNGLGQYVLYRVDPEKAEAIEAAALRRSEQEEYRNRGMCMRKTPGGGMRLSGSFPSTDATIIRTAIESLTSPRVSGGDDERTYTQRCGDALTEICNLALHSKDRPDHGGERPQVMLTMRLEDLRDEVGIGILEDGTPITAAQARRFACDAGVIPAVLGGKSQPLDLGRTRRLYTGTVRRALVLRDRGCAFPGCDRPPQWTATISCTGSRAA
jgi:hypothetical protein